MSKPQARRGLLWKEGSSYKSHWACTQLDIADVSPQPSELQSQWTLRNWSGSREKKSGNVGKDFKSNS